MSQRRDDKPFFDLSEHSYSRVFAGITVPDGPRKLLRQTAQQSIKHPQVRWTAPENYHLTLAFLGNLDRGQLSSLCQDIATRRAPECPEIKPLRIGRFPGPQGRILAAHVKRDPVLVALHQWIAGRVEANGIAIAEEGQYLPHITLARLDRHRDRPFPGAGITLTNAVAFSPSHFGLFRGTHRRWGDHTRYRYEPLALFPFAESTSANADSSSGY